MKTVSIISFASLTMKCKPTYDVKAVFCFSIFHCNALLNTFSTMLARLLLSSCDFISLSNVFAFLHITYA